MTEDLTKLSKSQINNRIAAKKQIVEFLEVDLKKHRREISALEKRPHDADTPMPKQEGVLDYKKMTTSQLQDKKRVLSKELARASGIVSELKIKIVAIDKIIVEKIKNK